MSTPRRPILTGMAIASSPLFAALAGLAVGAGLFDGESHLYEYVIVAWVVGAAIGFLLALASFARREGMRASFYALGLNFLILAIMVQPG